MSALLSAVPAAAKLGKALLALTLIGSIGAAQAQSGYTLTKLNEPFLGKLDAVGAIDSQNRVTATASYLTGFNLFTGSSYTGYVARWSASTGAAIGPTKLITRPHVFKHQSPDGSKVFVSPNHQYYDTTTRQFVAVPAPNDSGYWEVKGINDGGTMAGVAYVVAGNPPAETVRAVRWLPGAANHEVLPVGAGVIAASASFINQKGAIVGEVRVAGSELVRTAIWRESGVFELLSNAPDANARPLGLTESGDVLLALEDASTAVQSFALISNGVAKAIEAPNSADQVSAAAINAGGMVVGTVIQASAAEGFRDRGFIWKDGVFTDLTAWVVAKGLKLPTGAVISAAWRINAQGSILATLRDANGRTALVRLTAKP